MSMQKDEGQGDCKLHIRCWVAKLNERVLGKGWTWEENPVRRDGIRIT